MSARPPADIFLEESELFNQDPDVTVKDPDQILSKDQTYIEIMSGIRLYMAWSHIPDFWTLQLQQQRTIHLQVQSYNQLGKVSVRMPTK